MVADMPAAIDRVLSQLHRVILGKERPVRLALCCLLARGHLLIEDVPGVGKTTLANGLARLLGLQLKRVQFTSDLLPADITGTTVFDRERQQFTFHPGALFAQVVLADEVNRASPKTQSALLEAMEERQVTVDGQRHLLPRPFFVIATQNPQRQVGTFPLPESQLDRFLMRIELGFPGRDAEREMLAGGDRRTLLEGLAPALSAEELAAAQDAAAAVTVAPALTDYLLDLVARTREDPACGGGLSPRASLALQRAAQAWALMAGRDLVIPEDVQVVAGSVMGHRLRGSDAQHADGRALAEAVIRAVPVP
jgi:MoxR-like ATPase